MRLKEEEALGRRESRRKRLQDEALGEETPDTFASPISDHSLIERRFPVQPMTVVESL